MSSVHTFPVFSSRPNCKLKTAIKKVVVAAQSGNKEEATALLKEASKTIDMAASKNILHVNNAARKKSRLATLVNKMA